MRISRLFRWLLWTVVSILCFILIGLGGAWYYVNHVLDKEEIRAALEKSSSAFLVRTVSIESISWGLFPPHLEGKNVVLMDRQDREILRIPTVKNNLDVRQLLDGRLIVQEIVFAGGRILFRVSPKSLPVAKMIRDIRLRIENRKDLNENQPDPLVQLSFRWFVIDNVLLDVIPESQSPKNPPLTLLVNGRGELINEDGKVRFPFILNSEVQNPTGEGRLSVSGKLDKVSDVSVKADSFPISAFESWAPPLEFWDGKLDGNIQLSNPSGTWSWQASGSSDIFPKDVPTETVADATFDFHKVKGASVTIQMNGPEVKAISTVTWSSWPPSQLSIRVVGENLDWDKFQAWVPKIKSQDRPSKANIIPIDGNIDLSSVTLRSTLLTNIHADFKRTSTGTWVVDPIKFSGFGGDVSATFNQTPNKKFYATWNGTDLELSQVASLWTNQAGLKGRGNTAGEINGPIPFASILDLSARFSLSLEKGGFVNSPMFLKTATKLNLKSLVKGMRNEDNNALIFDRGVANLRLSNGELNFSEPGELENDTLEVALMGGVNLKTKMVNVDLIFNFLTVVDEVVSSIPGLRTVILGGEKSIVPVYVEVRGDWSDPKINVIERKSVTKPVENAIKGIFRLPGAAWDALTGKK